MFFATSFQMEQKDTRCKAVAVLIVSCLCILLTKIFEGCRDYSSLMPSCIGLE